jgi:hypothetical protein
MYETVGGNHAYVINPGLNALVGLPGSGYNHGPYVTVGVDLTAAGSSGVTGVSYYSINAGIGSRSPIGSAAWRPEAFVRLTPKQGTTVSSSIIEIGARIGLSFFN